MLSMDTELADRIIEGKQKGCEKCQKHLLKLSLDNIRADIRIQSLGNANDELREQIAWLKESARKDNVDWGGSEDDDTPTYDDN
ncbi:unnamed protein product, partial [marine sediment metagenome]